MIPLLLQKKKKKKKLVPKKVRASFLNPPLVFSLEAKSYLQPCFQSLLGQQKNRTWCICVSAGL